MPNLQQLRKAPLLTVFLYLSKPVHCTNPAYSKVFRQPPAKILPGLTDVVTKCNTFVEVTFMAHSRTQFVEGSESKQWTRFRSSIINKI